MTEINDLQTWVNRDYWEYTKIRGSDFLNIEDQEALQQAVIGELKTRQGTCYGVGLEDYGSKLYQILGQNIDDLVVKEVQDYVKDVANKYSQINSISIEELITYSDGSVDMKITIDSIFGKTIAPFSLCAEV
jgi:hypothetical protein